MEYFYFMPPAGKAFDRDIWRGQLSKALCGLDDLEKSLIVWKVDLRMTLDAPPTHAERTLGAAGNVYSAIQPFVDIASRNSLKELAGHWNVDRAQKATKWLFQHYWSGQCFDESEYIESKKSFDAWQALAREKWEKPEEQELSKWILSLKPPKNPIRFLSSSEIEKLINE